MSKEPVEICAIWKQSDGTELVHTGIYVFDITTIREVRELLTCFQKGGAPMPYKFEI